MKLSKVNIGDRIRITYKSCFGKEGTVITKLSGGIVLQTGNNHQMFFAKEFFNEDIEVVILEKNSDEIIVEEVLQISHEELKKAKCEEKIIYNDSVYTITGICYGGFNVEDDNFSLPHNCFFRLWDADMNKKYYIVRKVMDE